MTERPARKAPQIHLGQVIRTERLTPHMHRVVLGGEGLARFDAGQYTDHYVKLMFPAAGVTYPEPFDPGAIRATLPREQWPVTRTYSVRSWDPASRELALDFVLHGDTGLAARWAVRARPGDTLHFGGPGGGYAPDPAAAWHLLAGDESALPAIAAAMERMPLNARFTAFVEVSDAGEEQDIKGITWLHRGDRPVGTLLVPAVRELALTEADASTDAGAGVQAFVHGEAGFVKELRHHLRVTHRLPLERLSISGYWRLGHDEDGWQASKPTWNAQIEAEQGR